MELKLSVATVLSAIKPSEFHIVLDCQNACTTGALKLKFKLLKIGIHPLEVLFPGLYPGDALAVSEKMSFETFNTICYFVKNNLSKKLPNIQTYNFETLYISFAKTCLKLSWPYNIIFKSVYISTSKIQSGQ